MNNFNAVHFLEALGRNSLQAGVLVLVVLLAQRLFHRELTPRWRCALWLLVVVRLLLPLSVTSSTSIFNLMPGGRGQGVQAAPVMTAAPIVEFNYQPPLEALSSAPPDFAVPTGNGNPPPVAEGTFIRTVPSQPIPWPAVAVAIWLGGALVLLAHLLVSSVRLTRRFAHLAPVTDAAVLNLLDDCRRQLGVRSQLAVVEGADISSPALQGLFRPKLLLPKKFVGNFSARELRYIFLHELAHVKRRDLWLNWLMALLQVAHWFNPLVWIGFARWRADREVACDALAIETAGPAENREYGRTMLRLLENYLPHAAVPGMVGIFEDSHQLRQRVKMIASYRPAPRWSALGVLLLAVIAAGCLTDAKSQATNATNPLRQSSSSGADASLMLDLHDAYQSRFINHGQTNAEVVGFAGRQVYDGVPFQVDGRVEIYGRNFTKKYGPARPDQFAFTVGRKFDELHVLHGTYFADVDGQEIAFYRLNYADGSTAELPIIYGGQVRDYQRGRTEEKEQLSDPGSKVIWRGPGMLQILATQRRFKSQFENPHPDKVVSTIDIISTRHLASYFLDAATVVAHDPNRPVTPPVPADGPERHFDGVIAVRVIDAVTGQPLEGALLQPNIDVDGPGMIAAPLYTSATGEASIRYPMGRETNITLVVQKQHYKGQTGKWTVNFPDATTFRLVPVKAADEAEPWAKNSTVPDKKSPPVPAPLLYEGFDGRSPNNPNAQRGGTGWVQSWSSTGSSAEPATNATAGSSSSRQPRGLITYEGYNYTASAYPEAGNLADPALTGHLEADGTLAAGIDFKECMLTVQTNLGPVTVPKEMDTPAKAERWYQNRLKQHVRWPLQVGSDGTFRSEKLKPGKYVIFGEVWKNATLVATTETREVEIPDNQAGDMGRTIDIGLIVLKAVAPAEKNVDHYNAWVTNEAAVHNAMVGTQKPSVKGEYDLPTR